MCSLILGWSQPVRSVSFALMMYNEAKTHQFWVNSLLYQTVVLKHLSGLEKVGMEPGIAQQLIVSTFNLILTVLKTTWNIL